MARSRVIKSIWLVLLSSFLILSLGTIASSKDVVGDDFLSGKTFYVEKTYSSGNVRYFYWEFDNGNFIQTDPDTGSQDYGKYFCNGANRFIGMYKYGGWELHLFTGRETISGTIKGVGMSVSGHYTWRFSGEEVPALPSSLSKKPNRDRNLEMKR